MAEENTFLNADNIYEEVEGEQGKTLEVYTESVLGLENLKSQEYLLKLLKLKQ